MYTINGNLMHMDRNGNYIMHGAKGSEWKTHKYVDKILKNGKWVYKYAKNSLGSAKNRLTNIKNYSKNRDRLKAIDNKNQKYLEKHQTYLKKSDRAYQKMSDISDKSTKRTRFAMDNTPEHGKIKQNSIAGQYLKKADEAEKKAQIARIDKDMDAYRKYQQESQDNYTKAKAVEQNARNQMANIQNTMPQKYNKALVEYKTANSAKNYYLNKAMENSDERSDLYNKIYGNEGVPIKVQDAIDKLDEGKAKLSKAANTAKEKAKETASKVKDTAVSTANKAVKTADKVATKATDEFVSRILDSMERANVKKAEVKPAEVKPITLKENVLKENILKENVLKENVIGEKKRKKKR